jgi:hypothetical protein
MIWKSIDTAPESESQFLVFDPSEDRFVVVKRPYGPKSQINIYMFRFESSGYTQLKVVPVMLWTEIDPPQISNNLTDVEGDKRQLAP